MGPGYVREPLFLLICSDIETIGWVREKNIMYCTVWKSRLLKKHISYNPGTNRFKRAYKWMY